MRIRKCRLAIALVVAMSPLAVHAEGGFFDDLKKNVKDSFDQTKEAVKKSANDATSNLLGTNSKSDEQAGNTNQTQTEETTKLVNPIDEIKKSAQEKKEAVLQGVTSTKDQLTNTVDSTKNQVTGTVDNTTSQVTGDVEAQKQALENTRAGAKSKAGEAITDVTETGSRRADKAKETATAGAAAAVVTAATVSAAPGAPYGVDVIGLRLGMSPSETESAAKKFDSGALVQTHNGVLRNVANSDYIQKLTAQSQKTGNVEVIFAAPPSANNALMLSRNINYNNGQQPTVQNTVDALKGKYGEPGYEESSVTFQQFSWFFDASGKRAVKLSAEQAKMCFMSSGKQNFASKEEAKSVVDACGVMLTVYYMSKKVGTSDLVSSMSTTLISYPELLNVLEKSNAYANQQIQKEADKVAAPDL